MPSTNSIIGRCFISSHCRGPESQKRGIYFDPNGIRATITTIPVFDNIFSSDQFVALETLAAFSRGREAIRGCKVCVIKQQKRFFYVIFSKYRRGLVNFAIKGESTDQETWRGPLVVMRLDTQTASRVVSISSKFHRELAITAAARFTAVMNERISSASNKVQRIQWPTRL